MIGRKYGSGSETYGAVFAYSDIVLLGVGVFNSGSTIILVLQLKKTNTKGALTLSIVVRVCQKTAIVMSVHQSDHTLVNAGIMRRVQAGTPICPTYSCTREGGL